MNLIVFRYPEWEKYSFSGCFVCVCNKHNLKKKNYNTNSKFGILYVYHMQIPLKTFYENRKKSNSNATASIIRKNFYVVLHFVVGILSQLND